MDGIGADAVQHDVVQGVSVAEEVRALDGDAGAVLARSRLDLAHRTLGQVVEALRELELPFDDAPSDLPVGVYAEDADIAAAGRAAAAAV